MARIVSLDARRAFNAQETADVPIILVTITQPEIIDGPLRLSSDPTVRLSIDPLEYGTRSRGEVYKFVLMAAVLPDDKEDALTSVQLMLENVEADMTKVVRASITPATMTFEMVMASAPDSVEMRWAGLVAMRTTYDAGQIMIEVSRESILGEPWPAHRMTQNRFPGLYR
jgi:hypothetical protein